MGWVSTYKLTSTRKCSEALLVCCDFLNGFFWGNSVFEMHHLEPSSLNLYLFNSETSPFGYFHCPTCASARYAWTSSGYDILASHPSPIQSSRPYFTIHQPTLESSELRQSWVQRFTSSGTQTRSPSSQWLCSFVWPQHLNQSWRQQL